jgi:hypothetical protein
MSRGATYLGLLATLRQEELLSEAQRRQRATNVIRRCVPPSARLAQAKHQRHRPDPAQGSGRFVLLECPRCPDRAR